MSCKTRPLTAKTGISGYNAGNRPDLHFGRLVACSIAGGSQCAGRVCLGDKAKRNLTDGGKLRSSVACKPRPRGVNWHLAPRRQQAFQFRNYARMGRTIHEFP